MTSKIAIAIDIDTSNDEFYKINTTMDYSINEAKSIFELIKGANNYAIVIIIALVFPLIWVLLKKLLGINNTANATTSSSIPSNSIDSIGKLISLKGNTGDKIVFYSSITLFFIGLLVLKVGEKKEEKIRQEAIALKQHFKLNAQTSICPKDIPKYLANNLDDILFQYPNQFIKGVAVENGESVETIFCIDTEFVRTYKNIVDGLFTEYIDNRLDKEGKISIASIVEGKNDVQNYFVNRFMYSFLSEKTSTDKYWLDVDSNNNIFLTTKKTPGSISDSQIKTAVEEIIKELSTMPGNFEGFNVLRGKLHKPQYTDDFLKQVVKGSAGKLELTNLTDLKDPIGIKLK